MQSNLDLEICEEYFPSNPLLNSLKQKTMKKTKKRNQTKTNQNKQTKKEIKGKKKRSLTFLYILVILSTFYILLGKPAIKRQLICFYSF